MKETPAVPNETAQPVIPQTPANSTFSTPPPTGSKLPVVILVSIFLLLVVLGAVYYFFFMKNAPKATPTTQNTVPTSIPTTPTPTIYDTSDEGLTNDASTIEINMTELESNAASVDSGLSETTPNL